MINHIERLEDKGALLFIFGATGDLAKRKLYPAIYSLFLEGKLDEQFAVIGLARRPRTNEQFRYDVDQSIREFARHRITDDEQYETFLSHFNYMSLDVHHKEGFKELLQLAERLEAQHHTAGNRLFYLAIAPELFGVVAHHLRDGGLLQTEGWHRLVIEKPFGHDFASAELLNNEIRDVFEEEDIFRIDHYLGKEMVQNIQVIRFANAFFEPLWNNKYIANIQITLSETVGVEERGGYYDDAGALNDMAQNHMLQMLAMLAMEPPSRMEAEDLRAEKVKVFRALRGYASQQEVREHVVRGQYTDGELNQQLVRAYRDEPNVAPDSMTDTFFAAKVFVDNFRWAGVPFYIRTGKRMPVKTTEVVVEFKNMPDNVYFSEKNKLEPNLLVFRVNPFEGIYFRINAKTPGSAFAITPVAMDFCQSCQVGYNTPEAYERLLLDAIRGDSSFFTGWEEVSLAWRFIDRIKQAWNEDSSDLVMYKAGTWGPQESIQLLAKDGFKWWPIDGQDEGEVTWVSNQM